MGLAAVPCDLLDWKIGEHSGWKASESFQVAPKLLDSLPCRFVLLQPDLPLPQLKLVLLEHLVHPPVAWVEIETSKLKRVNAACARAVADKHLPLAQLSNVARNDVERRS